MAKPAIALKRRRGRPARSWRWLVHDVDAIMGRNGCSVEDACGYLCDGAFTEKLPIYIPEGVELGGIKGPFHGRASVVWGKWRGMKIDTLKRKYYLAKAAKPATHKNHDD